jgi:hypothetical protein
MLLMYLFQYDTRPTLSSLTKTLSLIRVPPLGGGKASLRPSCTEGNREVLGFCYFVGFGFEGLSGFGLVGFGFEVLGWSLCVCLFT